MQVRKYDRVYHILEVVICSFPINVRLMSLILTIIEIYNTATETFTKFFSVN